MTSTDLPTHVDVLVIGCGAAGAAAAISAHDAGASVAVIEKWPTPGGNCRHSGGFLFEIGGPRAVEHLDALGFGRTEHGVLEAYARGLPEVSPWIGSLGGQTRAVDPGAFGGMLPSWPHFPGAGHVSYRQFAPADGAAPGEGLWRCLQAALSARGIPVFCDTPALALCTQDGAVTGARVGLDGDERELHARGGVVLASGGFEYDAEARDAYLPLALHPVGHPGNTGDTLRLAANAGASWWHMSAFFGWFAYVHPQFPAAFTLDVHAPSFIYVDGDGHRFADETGWEVHDKVRSATAYLPRRANRPRLPGFIVFDEAARTAGPLHGVVGSPNGYAWSADNSAELAAGWIATGTDPEALADACGVDSATLRATLERYGQAVVAGHDEDFGRSPATLTALEPPLYAIALTPGLATASGGPRHDQRARVLAPGRRPIPGLYAAGGAGSIWGHLTEHGGGLTDAIVFGRIASAEAAAAAGPPSDPQETA